MLSDHGPFECTQFLDFYQPPAINNDHSLTTQLIVILLNTFDDEMIQA